jgi:hypothetical protein
MEYCTKSGDQICAVCLLTSGVHPWYNEGGGPAAFQNLEIRAFVNLHNFRIPDLVILPIDSGEKMWYNGNLWKIRAAWALAARQL